MVSRSSANALTGGAPATTASQNAAEVVRAGTKRKTRGLSPSKTQPAPGGNGREGVVDGGATASASVAGRVTRRSAAAAASATPGISNTGPQRGGFEVENTSPTSARPSSAVEPARGEEANLIGNEWGSASKRRRRASPVKAQPTSAPKTAVRRRGEPEAGPSTAALSSAPVLRTLSNQSAPSAHPTGASPSRHPPHPFYPYVSTPFRYPCLHPERPAPPPGNPKNPQFKRYDPHFWSTLPTSSDPSKAKAVPASTTRQPLAAQDQVQAGPSSRPAVTVPNQAGHPHPDDFAPDFIGWAGLADQPSAQASPAPQPHNHNIQPPQPQYPQTLNDSDLTSYFSNDPTYASISALLSASQIPFRGASAPDPGDGYPTSPGARSDGLAGPLSPSMQGRYSVTKKADCEPCVTDQPGHPGHWQRHA